MMLHIDSVYKSFGGDAVVRGAGFSVAEGETAALIGPSGAGKSTLLRIIGGLETPDSGSVRVERGPIGMVFQGFHLFPHKNVLDNLILAPVTVRREPKEAARTRARALLNEVGLAHKEAAMPSRLSGGERQRVAIARALMMEPALLLFDEPTSALDPQLTAEVLGVMQALARKKMTMLVVTHELAFARQAADRVYFMSGGEIVEGGMARAMFEAPRTAALRAFLSPMPPDGVPSGRVAT